MNWRKRKRFRRIAKHYGYDHYYEYKRNLKFCLYYTAFDNALKCGLYHWSEMLPKMNQMFCNAGLPEYCMTQEEFYAKVMGYIDESDMRNGVIVQFTNNGSSSRSIKIDKPTNIVVRGITSKERK